MGKAVLRIRTEKDMTRDAFIARAQVQGWTISTDVLRTIENGEREVTDIELKRLAKILRVSISGLFD